MSQNFKNRGYTLIEILLVLALVVVLLFILLPSFRGIRQEAQLDDARWKLEVLKSAVESYYRHHLDIARPHPPDIYVTLQTATPRIVKEIIKDPFTTHRQTSPATFSYSQSSDTDQKYYVIWSHGINRLREWRWVPNDASPTAPTEISLPSGSDDLVVSNLPVKKY